MIYYDIQHHGDTSNIIRLAELLQASGNSLSICLDSNSNELIEDTKANLDHLKFSHVRVSKSLRLSWGGFSIVQQMRQALKKSLEVSGWEWFINLSGVCCPLMCQSNIQQILHDAYAKSDTVGFLSSFTPQVAPEFLVDLQPEIGRYKFEYGRVTLNTDVGIKKLFDKNLFHPSKNVNQRVGAVYREIGKNEYSVTRYTPYEVKDLLSYFEEQPLRVGRQWIILHRKQVEWLVASSFVETLAQRLSNFFIPDESFFQMALFSKNNPFLCNLNNNSLRYKGGAAANLNLVDVSQLTNKGDIFARKIVKSESTAIYQYLDKGYANG